MNSYCVPRLIVCLFIVLASSPCWVGDCIGEEAPASEASPAVFIHVEDVHVENEDSGEADTTKETPLGRPTHKQVDTIEINGGDLDQTSLTCFCLAPNGNVLAACGTGTGEIRVFDPAGKYLASHALSLKPEAINVGSDGNIYVAGEGKLLKLDADGNSLLEKNSPHVQDITSDPEKVRQEVVEQAQQMGEQITEQLEMYDRMIAAIREKEEDERTADETQQLTMLEQIQEQYQSMAKEYGGEELTEAQIDEKVKASIEYKIRTASISEYGGEVFVATGSSEGYGYNVWKMDDQFENGEAIISGLSGCCGQMDVQCCKSGIFVAENSRHRVAHYDLSGKMLDSWGKQSRKGLHGFGSCCNPMNVAFGAEGSVYTSEATSGRIKQFTPEGELIALIGKVDLVPGCDKVAIGVAPDGDRIYMLDINNNRILVMGRLQPGEIIAYSESDEGSGNSFFDSLKSALGL